MIQCQAVQHMVNSPPPSWKFRGAIVCPPPGGGREESSQGGLLFSYNACTWHAKDPTFDPKQSQVKVLRWMVLPGKVDNVDLAMQISGPT